MHTGANHQNEPKATGKLARWTSTWGLSTAASAAVLGLIAASLAHCDQQPAPYCLTSTSTYATRLVEKKREESQPGACTGLGPASFNADPEVSFASYFEKDDKGQPDYSKTSVAVQTTELGSLLSAAQAAGTDDQATDGKVYSIGPFSAAQSDSNGFCTVPTMTPTHLVLPASGMTPAVDIELTWSNVQVYVTAATIGTQVQADLVDRRVTAAGTCTITYKALSLAPAIMCGVTNAEGGAVMTPDGGLETDPTLCDPLPEPDAGRYQGSGIGPTTSIMCDPATAYCTIKGDSVPALH